MHTDDIKTSTWVGFSGPGDIDSLAPAQTIRETRMIYLKRAIEKGEISRKCSGPFPKAYPGVTAQPPPRAKVFLIKVAHSHLLFISITITFIAAIIISKTKKPLEIDL